MTFEEAAATRAVVNALKVFTLDPKILGWLQKNDPMALKQALEAIRKAEEIL